MGESYTWKNIVSLYNCIPNFDKCLNYKCIFQFLIFIHLFSKYLVHKKLETLLSVKNIMTNKMDKISALINHMPSKP